MGSRCLGVEVWDGWGAGLVVSLVIPELFVVLFVRDVFVSCSC